MMERNAASAFAMQGSLHLDDDDMDILADVDTESVDDGARADGSVDDTSLCIASHLVRTRWRDQDGVAAAGIPALHQPWKEFPDLSIDSFTPTPCLESDTTFPPRLYNNGQTINARFEHG